MYAEEWECYSRILSKKITGVSLEKTLFYGRKHANSNTGEFWRNDPIRRNSKKEAIRLIIENLSVKGLLTPYLFTFLSGQAIVFRDKKLIDNIIKSANFTLKQNLTINLKYYTYPLWVIYKRTITSSKKKRTTNSEMKA